MFYVYILHCSDGLLYTGYTPDLRNRIKAHEGGFVPATRYRRPVRLIHYESFIKESDSKRRELFLKGGNGKQEIEKMLIDYFRDYPWQKSESIRKATSSLPQKPPNTIVCPVCNG